MNTLKIAVTALVLFISQARAQEKQSTNRQYIEPLELATLLESPDAGNMLILNTGPVDDIKGAVNIGAVSEAKNLKKLKKTLA